MRRPGGATRRFAFARGNGMTVPDPYGGRAWRLMAFTAGAEPGARLGAGLRELRDRARPPRRTQREFAARPCQMGTAAGGDPDSERGDPFLDRAQIERRLQTGRTIVQATCSADVERVTLSTPRDVRTLVPSPVGHVVLAVYDGAFVDGELELTAHLRGGRTWTERFPLGF
jgi:hypothetical protein